MLNTVGCANQIHGSSNKLHTFYVLEYSKIRVVVLLFVFVEIIDKRDPPCIYLNILGKGAVHPRVQEAEAGLALLSTQVVEQREPGMRNTRGVCVNK